MSLTKKELEAMIVDLDDRLFSFKSKEDEAKELKELHKIIKEKQKKLDNLRKKDNPLSKVSKKIGDSLNNPGFLKATNNLGNSNLMNESLLTPQKGQKKYNVDDIMKM